MKGHGFNRAIDDVQTSYCLSFENNDLILRVQLNIASWILDGYQLKN